MRPDGINFMLTKEVSLSIGGDGQGLLLVGDRWNYITDTNFGQFLLDTQGWGPAQPEPFRWPMATGGRIQ